MFSPAIGRAARLTCSRCATTYGTARTSTVPAVNAAAPALQKPSHQRRHSSSKTPVPPRGGVGAPQQTRSSVTSKTGEKKSVGRNSRKRASDVAKTAKASPSMNIPHVPSTGHLHKSDVELSSFFSLHRPISVTTPIPVSSTAESFSGIFEPRQIENNKFGNVIYTISNAVEALEGGAAEAASREEAFENQIPPVDPGRLAERGAAMVNLEKLILQYRPFNPPPAPKPLGGVKQGREPGEGTRSHRKTKGVARKNVRKPWNAAMPLTGASDPSGSDNLAAHPYPTVEISMPALDHDMSQEGEVTVYQPFLNRMHERWRKAQKIRGPMLLISVKRQRKLKMKKHKYKKLMKRTRTLRRKLDRT